MPDTTDAFVQRHLTELRNRELRHRFISTVAGRVRLRLDTERMLRGPDGQAIRVIEDIKHGTHIEHGDHLHAVVRPSTLRMRTKIQGR
jgi:hypothetical protein